jgi:hypothetical protein
MGHRQFSDSTGAAWEVWDVQPAPVVQPPPVDRPPTFDGRLAQTFWDTPRLDGPLAKGWLCFQSGTVKRRLAPIPDGWQELDGVQLAELCALASAVPPRGLPAAPPVAR